MTEAEITYIDQHEFEDILNKSTEVQKPIKTGKRQEEFQWRSNSRELTRITDFAVTDLINDAFNELKYSVELGKQRLKIVPILVIKDNCLAGTLSKLKFKIGTKKMYLIKDIGLFLSALLNGSTLTYGKNTVIGHRREYFDELSQQLLDLIKICYTKEGNHSLGRLVDGKPQDKYLYLHAGGMDFFLEWALEAGAILLEEDGKKERTIPVYKNKPFLSLSATQQTGAYILEMNESVRLLEGCETVGLLKDEGLYCIANQNSGRLRYFLKKLIDNHGVFTVLEKDMQSVYTMLLKPIQDFVVIPESLAVYESPAMEAKLYLDQPEQDHIQAQLIFDYAGQQYKGFTEKDPNIPRDLQKEYIIENMISNYFSDGNTADGRYYVRQSDTLFTLFDHGLKEIANYCTIYANKRLKPCRIYKAPAINVGVRVNSGLLHLNLDIENKDMYAEILPEMVEATRKELAYYRLKDGSFITLKNHALDIVAALTDGLGISTEDFQKEEITVPAYRALYIDSLLRDRSETCQFNSDAAFQSIIQAFKKTEDKQYKIPVELVTILRDYQITGFQWLRTLSDLKFGGILADDMGLGKTIQVIALLLSYYKHTETKQYPSLVVCPSSLILNWQHELAYFGKTLKTVVIMGTREEREKMLYRVMDSEVIITSYDLLKRDITWYTKMKFAYMVLDEAQAIKNYRTLNAKAVKTVNAAYRFALTGTPVENNLSELWSIFDYLMPGYLYTYSYFKSHFEEPIVRDQNKKVLKRLQKMTAPFILRRMKKDVLAELPEKVETTVYAALENMQKKYYAKTMIAMCEELKDDKKENNVAVLAMLTKLRQICCDPVLIDSEYTGNSSKKALCMELAEDAIQAGHKILIFSQFTSMLDILEKMFNEKKIKTLMLTGNISVKERQKRITRFQTGDIPIFLISLKAGGAGINLTEADVVIHYDPWWNLSTKNQATDRSYRMGQKNTVQVYSLIMKDSVEEKIEKLQKDKALIAKSVMEAGLSNLTYKKLLELFEGTF